jgi:hypothetical protein
MKIKNENLYISEEGSEVTGKVIKIQLEYGFTFEETEKLTESEIYTFIANTIKNKIDRTVKRDNIEQHSEVLNKYTNTATVSEGIVKESKLEGIGPLSKGEQRVYDIISGAAPVDKKTEIIWRWPENKDIPTKIQNVVVCDLHKEARVCRYSYVKRLNPSGEQNFWISHVKSIDDEWCQQDINVDDVASLIDELV